MMVCFIAFHHSWINLITANNIVTCYFVTHSRATATCKTRKYLSLIFSLLKTSDKDRDVVYGGGGNYIFHHSTSHNSATLLNSSSAGTGQSLIHCISFTFHNERSVLSGICFLISGKRLSRRDLLSISSSL